MPRIDSRRLIFKTLRGLRPLLPDALGRGLMRGRAPRIRRMQGERERRWITAADVVVVSHPKAGRTWLRALLSRLYQRRHGLPADELLDLDNFHRRAAEVPVVLFSDDNYVNDLVADPLAECPYAGKRVVLLVRNPIDVAVSIFHQHRRRTSLLKKDLNDIPYDMERVALLDYVRDHPQGLRHVLDHMNRWAAHAARVADLAVVRYEDLHAAPAEHLGRVAAFLGTPFERADLDEAVAFAAADNLRRMEAGGHFRGRRLAPRDAADPDSFKVRRARVRGYTEDFAERDVRALEASVRARLDRFYAPLYPELFEAESAPR
jgi:alcohol sulfotransferase